MNLSIKIFSASALEGAEIHASGISGRMNLKKTANLSEGENEFTFTFTLPSCNVCGGIRSGTHDIECGVTYGNTVIKNTTSVEIQQ
jgi:hypothetical protein